MEVQIRSDGTRMSFMVFRLDRQRYGVRLSSVERVVRAVLPTALPKAPPVVLGVVNVRGAIYPVFDLRRRFGLPKKEIHPGDAMILASTTHRPVAFIADDVDGLVDRTEGEEINSPAVHSYTPYLEGVVKLEDGLILIHDLESFLSLDETAELDTAMMPSAGQA